MHNQNSDSRFFGQPKALKNLVLTETFERFAHHGMQALLVLYMVKHLLLPGNSESVWLLQPLQSLFGGISGQPLASAIFGTFTALAFASQIVGGYVADRWLGTRSSIRIGCLLLAIGYLLLAFQATFLIALVALIIGNGLFKCNMASQIGQLYTRDDHRRVDAYQLFTISIAIGGISAALLVGPVGETLGWHYGFIISAAAMTVGTAIFWSDRSALSADRAASEASATAISNKHRILMLGLLWPIITLLVVPNYQIFNAYMVWGDTNFELSAFGFSIPTTSLILFAGIASIVGTIIYLRFWRWWRRHWREPDDMSKLLIGALFVMAGTSCLVLAAALQKPGERIGLALPIAFHFLAGIGYAHIGPVGLAMVGRLAPERAISTAMGFYYLAFGAGSIIVGMIGAYYSSISATMFWSIHAGIAAIVCICLWGLRHFGATGHRFQSALPSSAPQYDPNLRSG